MARTIEISNGKIVLIEKNEEQEVIIKVTVAEAVAAAMELPQGKSSDDRYEIVGYVDSIAIEYSEQYNNISFFMTDTLEKPTYDFEAYRVACTPEQAPKVVVGKLVRVVAALQHYYKAATEELPEVELAETVAGGILSFPEEDAVIYTRDNGKAIKRIENGQLVIIRSGVRYNAVGAIVK